MIIPPPLSVNTGNWGAGYEWHNGGVAATEFTVPNFPYNRMSSAEKANHTAMAIWAGLTNGREIAQIGIYDHVANGITGWYGVCAFWPRTDNGCGGAISPGDKIFASVHRSGLTYTLSMKDAGPHHFWSVSIKGTTGSVDTTAEVIAEDTQYPGYSATPLTPFSPVRAVTSGDPAQEVYSSWGFARKLSSSEIEIDHR